MFRSAMNIGVIGFGYWGPNLVRNFKKTKNCNVTHIAELHNKKHQNIQKMYPEINIKTFDEIIKNPNIDAVVIATAISTHYVLAKKALENGKHVLVEKPLTNSVKNTKELIKLSKKMKKVLMVDHTYLYTGAIQKIKALITNNVLGEILYIDSTRMNLGLFQNDFNVLWDLAPHDISIILYLIDEKPISVQAIGKSHITNKLEDIAYLTLCYKSNKISHVNCSWISPIKIRQILIGGSRKMLVYDDLKIKKIKVYDRCFHETNSNRKFTINYKRGEYAEPTFSTREGLSVMTEDFVNSIVNNTHPISNYNMGLEVVKILEAAQESISNNGQEIFLQK